MGLMDFSQKEKEESGIYYFSHGRIVFRSFPLKALYAGLGSSSLTGEVSAHPTIRSELPLMRPSADQIV